MTTLTSPSTRRSRAVSYLRDLWQRREFAWFLAIGNLKARNASTTLGLFWWVLNPLLLGLVYYLVFGFILGTRDIGYLLAGMFPFHFTARSLTGGANSILSNAKLLANLKFPRLVLPVAYLVESMIGFLASLLVLGAILVGTGGLEITANTSLLVFVLPLHFLFNLGLASMTARLAVPFRDINNFVPYLSRLWLYVSPIIWPLSLLDSLSASVRPWLEANPMFSVVAVYRGAFLGFPVESGMLLTTALWSISVFTLGVMLFVRYEGHMVRHL